MSKQIYSKEKPCTFEDLVKLESLLCKAKKELRFSGGFILIISIILPFLPPKYPGSKAMLDIMSYSTAVACVVAVLGIVFLWTVYFMLYGILKDQKKKIKISVSTYVTSIDERNYKGRNYCFFSAAGLPYRLGRLPINDEEFGLLKKGDNVIVEYSKYGKKLLGYDGLKV